MRIQKWLCDPPASNLDIQTKNAPALAGEAFLAVLGANIRRFAKTFSDLLKLTLLAYW